MGLRRSDASLFWPYALSDGLVAFVGPRAGSSTVVYARRRGLPEPLLAVGDHLPDGDVTGFGDALAIVGGEIVVAASLGTSVTLLGIVP
jgi:hypothetical protein